MGKRLIWALDFIHGHLNGNFTLDQLAQAACLSKFHLLRCFQKAFGLTPFQYAAKLKADRAQQLVEDPQWEIQEIRAQLGFSEPAAFSRFFKSHFGSTPSTYRKSNLGQVRS
jgi:AraC-like DNA-binding protein